MVSLAVILLGVAHLACDDLVLNTIRDTFSSEAAQVRWYRGFVPCVHPT